MQFLSQKWKMTVLTPKRPINEQSCLVVKTDSESGHGFPCAVRVVHNLKPKRVMFGYEHGINQCVYNIVCQRFKITD
jgi:hypothetical protein